MAKERKTRQTPETPRQDHQSYHKASEQTSQCNCNCQLYPATLRRRQWMGPNTKHMRWQWMGCVKEYVCMALPWSISIWRII